MFRDISGDYFYHTTFDGFFTVKTRKIRRESKLDKKSKVFN